mmetsp:Transcript_63132/g.159252  ORF Transcript_63132/g.159252 Transcript_63132/m.159252 type:complete len:256 (+) Transcript_63132:138-905(+)
MTQSARPEPVQAFSSCRQHHRRKHGACRRGAQGVRARSVHGRLAGPRSIGSRGAWICTPGFTGIFPRQVRAHLLVDPSPDVAPEEVDVPRVIVAPPTVDLERCLKGRLCVRCWGEPQEAVGGGDRRGPDEAVVEHGLAAGSWQQHPQIFPLFGPQTRVGEAGQWLALGHVPDQCPAELGIWRHSGPDRSHGDPLCRLSAGLATVGGGGKAILQRQRRRLDPMRHARRVDASYARQQLLVCSHPLLHQPCQVQGTL